MSAKNHREGRKANHTNQRRRGTNPRRTWTDPRMMGTNPRALGTNPRALCTNPHPGKSEATGQWRARVRRRQIITAGERMGWEVNGSTVRLGP